MALLNLEDIKSIKLKIPVHTECPDFMEFTKAINEIQVETKTKIKLQQIVLIEILGNGDDVEEARRRVGQINDNLDQIKKEIEILEREKVELAQATTKLVLDKMVILEHDLKTQIKEINSNFEKISEQIKKAKSALIGEDIKDLAQSSEDQVSIPEIKSSLSTIQDEVSNTLDNSGNLLLEPITNLITEEIKKLNINMGHALKLDIQINGTRLKDAFEKMETNIKFSNKLMSEMVNKQLQFKTGAVTNKILEMVANNIKVEENTQEEDVISDEELENFYKSEEYVDFIKYDDERLPLHAACGLGRLDVVKKLIKKGYDINIKDDDNLTPLMHATWKNQKEIVEYLISKNADLNIRSKVNQTALIYARLLQNKEIIEILRNHGATE